MKPILLWFSPCLFFAAFPAVSVAGQQVSSSPNIGIGSASPALPPTPEMAFQESLRKQRASLEKQKQAIHLQLGGKTATEVSPSSSVEQFIAPLIPVNQLDCPPLDSGKLNEVISSAAQKQSLDPALLRSVIKQESGFRPCAVSLKGAQGLMQLMPATARELHVSDAFDPVQNVHAGAAYLKQLLDRYKGDLRLALVGYNAGPGRADQGAETPYPVETQNYVASIFSDLGLDQPEVASDQEDLAPSDTAEVEPEQAAKDAKAVARKIFIPTFPTPPEMKINLKVSDPQR